MYETVVLLEMNLQKKLISFHLYRMVFVLVPSLIERKFHRPGMYFG